MVRGVWLMSEKVTDIEEDRRRMEARHRRKLEGGPRAVSTCALCGLNAVWFVEHLRLAER